MTKTHAEFLEELKSFVLENEWKDEFGTKVIYSNEIIKRIEQFEAEQKVDDENK